MRARARATFVSTSRVSPATPTRQNLALLANLEAVADAKGATVAQLALAWVLSRGQDIVPIPGTKRRKWLRENIAADDIVLSDEDVAALEAAIPRDAVVGERYVAAGMRNRQRLSSRSAASASSTTSSHHAITWRSCVAKITVAPVEPSSDRTASFSSAPSPLVTSSSRYSDRARDHGARHGDARAFAAREIFPTRRGSQSRFPGPRGRRARRAKTLRPRCTTSTA